MDRRIEFWICIHLSDVVEEADGPRNIFADIVLLIAELSPRLVTSTA
jgi:hypothetical protein